MFREPLPRVSLDSLPDEGAWLQPFRPLSALLVGRKNVRVGVDQCSRSWGALVYRLRFTVIGVMVAAAARPRRVRPGPREASQPERLGRPGLGVGRARPSWPTAPSDATPQPTSWRSTPRPRARRSTTPSSSAKIIENLDSLAARTTRTRSSRSTAATSRSSTGRSWRPPTDPTSNTRSPAIAIKGDNDTEVDRATSARSATSSTSTASTSSSPDCSRSPGTLNDTMANDMQPDGDPGDPGRRRPAVLHLRRRRRGGAATDRRRPDRRRRQRRRPADHQLHRGQLVRRARGLADRARSGDRLRPVHRQPVPRGDRRGLRHRATPSAER